MREIPDSARCPRSQKRLLAASCSPPRHRLRRCWLAPAPCPEWRQSRPPVRVERRASQRRSNADSWSGSAPRCRI